MFSALRAGEMTDGGDTSSSDDIRRALARELHDRVTKTLTTMLLNLENFKTDQVGNPRVLGEITDLQESTRDALGNLRHVLYDLRGPTGIEEALTNVRLHSAASLVELALGPAFDNQVAVEVKDDGLEVESVLGCGTTSRAILPRKQLL